MQPTSHTSNKHLSNGLWMKVCLYHLTRFHFSDKWNHLISDFNFRNEILWLLLPCHFGPCLTRLMCLCVCVWVRFLPIHPMHIIGNIHFMLPREHVCMHMNVLENCQTYFKQIQRGSDLCIAIESDVCEWKESEHM